MRRGGNWIGIEERERRKKRKERRGWGRMEEEVKVLSGLENSEAKRGKGGKRWGEEVGGHREKEGGHIATHVDR